MLYFLDELNEENISYSDIFDEDDLEHIRKLDDYGIGIVDEDYYKKAFVDIDEDLSLEISVFKSDYESYNLSHKNNLIQIEDSSNGDLSKDFKKLLFDNMESFISKTSFADDDLE